MANHSGRNVVRSAETGKRITPTVIKQYANNRVKFPQLPYRFEWIK